MKWLQHERRILNKGKINQKKEENIITERCKYNLNFYFAIKT